MTAWRFTDPSANSNTTVASDCGFYRAREYAAQVMGSSPTALHAEDTDKPADFEVREVGRCDSGRGEHKRTEARRRLGKSRFSEWEET